MGAALVMAVQVQAAFFDITFDSNDGSTTANAFIAATDLGGGVFQATSGTIEVSSSTFAPGTYTLVSNPNSPNQAVSPSGSFNYDNNVISGANPFLTYAGLLFEGPNAQTIELNLFSNGASAPVPNGTYQLYDSTGANLYGNATITPVPEPTTMVAGAMLLIPFGISTLRMLRKSRTA